MYNNGQTNFDTKRSVCLEEKEQADAIKSNLDKILHYERYRTDDKAVNENKFNTPVNTYSAENNARYSAPVMSDRNAYSEQTIAMPTAGKEENTENLRPTSTTMQFESSQDNDIFEDVGYKQIVKHEENFSISGKGKLLIAVYALVVALILSLVIINSRMLRSLDSSISAFGTKIENLNAEYTKISEELDVANGEEAISKWATEHGYQRNAA